MKNKLLTALLSVVIALGLWLYVVTAVSPSTDKQYNNIPVVRQSEILLYERGLMVTEMDVSAVSVHLEGNRSDLNKLSRSNIVVTLDVSNIYEAGTHELPYTLGYPGDVAQNAIKVLSRTPGKITVKVEDRVSKAVPVDVQYAGSLAENLMADKENKELDYDEVNITGPKSVIDQISVAKVRVDLEGRSESISEQFSYTLCDSQGEPVDDRLVTKDVASIKLTLRIMRVKEIALSVKIINGGGATEQNSQVTISPETIWVSGSDMLLEGIGSLEIGTIDLAEIPTDQVLTFPIKLPEGITDETGVTEATVEVKLPELVTKTLTVSNIKVINVPEGLAAELLTKALEIQIRGPKANIEKLKDSDITVNVDFTGTQTGTVKVKAVIVSSDPDVGAVGSYTVSANVHEAKK